MGPEIIYMIVMAVVSLAMNQKAQSQQKKHQRKILEAQERQAEQEKKLRMKQEKDAHKKRQAQLRAKMGAAGTGYGGGSSDAILNGLREDTRENLLAISSGAQMNKELGRLSATDGVSEGLKNAETALDFTDQMVTIAKKA